MPTCFVVGPTGPTGASSVNGSPAVQVSAGLSIGFNVTTNVSTLVPLTSVISGNAGGWFNPVTSLFTAPESGIYLAIASAMVVVAATNGNLRVIIAVNGVSRLFADSPGLFAGSVGDVSIGGALNLNVGDTLSMRALVNIPSASLMRGQNNQGAFRTILNIVSLF